MSHITVTFKGSSKQRLDMRWLSDIHSQTNNVDEVKKQTLLIGNTNVEIGDLFEISGKVPCEQIVLENANNKMDYVGYALAKGSQLTAMGDIGHYSGANLSGGNLKVNGDVLNYAGCSMSGGLIEITGSGKDYIGSAFAGEKKGMSGR